ncbi:catalase family protein [Archangium violaceum]|uniref:catalase family protein n=1 Tax=Archangium violaceum TaxID=83451 RepID=UPI002B28D2D5|nr:catalase family protein [Archangium gephyra]
MEVADPNFGELQKKILDRASHYTTESVTSEGQAVRSAHATGYGLARAEVEILGGLAAPYAQGIYARPGRHEAMVRFSNGNAHMGPDAWLGAVCGMGLKIFDIDGPTLLEDEADSRTFDYAMINHPVFFVNTLEHYVFIQQLFLERIGVAPVSNEPPEKQRARIHKFLYDWVTGMGTLPPERWAWDDLGGFLSVAQVKPINLLLSTYWTMGAVRHGDYIAKVRIAPTPASAESIVRRTLDLKSGRSVFRPALVSELEERAHEFEIQVQLCTDLAHMPVEELSVRWSEQLSPFVTVAKLRLPKQDIGGDDNFAKMDATSINPWRVTEAHRPLGNVMRVRKEAYRQSSILRHKLNKQPRKEPKNLAEVFGS